VQQATYVGNWLKLFIIYLHTGMDRMRFMTFLATIGGGGG
jgi:hypothetical protein